MTGVAHFEVAQMRAEIERVKGATEFHKEYGKETGPGFWLVGDRGIYFMGNHVRAEAPPFDVVFAAESNPNTLPFDEWYEAKREIFGGDDGSDFIPLASIERVVERAEKDGKSRLRVIFEADRFGIEPA